MQELKQMWMPGIYTSRVTVSIKNKKEQERRKQRRERKKYLKKFYKKGKK